MGGGSVCKENFFGVLFLKEFVSGEAVVYPRLKEYLSGFNLVRDFNEKKGRKFTPNLSKQGF